MATTGKQANKPAIAETMAVIDIGSNSIRMAMGQVLPDGKLEILERLRRAVRLGQDTFCDGRLHAQTMRSALAILRDTKNGREAAIIGRVREGSGVRMITRLGGSRLIDVLYGEGLPRIC